MLKRYSVWLLVIATILVYANSLFNEFVWDDEQFIYRNQHVARFAIGKIFTTNTIDGAGEISNYYRPITTLSFAIDYQFWRLNPFGYHLVNTLLHLGTGLLLFYLLQLLAFNRKTSFFVAAIFLLHPLQTEAVTYTNSRGDSMFAFFGMASLVLMQLSLIGKKSTWQLYNLKFQFEKRFFTLAAVLLYLASILGKEIGLAILGLHGLLLLKAYLESIIPKNIFQSLFPWIKKHTWSIAAFFLMVLTAVGYLFARATVLNFGNTFNSISSGDIYYENTIVRLLTFIKIIFIYWRLIIFPYPLHMERDTANVVQLANPWLLLFALISSAIMFFGWKQWKKQQKITIIFGYTWFLLLLVPVSGIIPINGKLYEHWLYLPLIGFCLMVLGLFQFFARKKFFLLQPMIIGILIIFSLLTIRQNYLWGTPIRLYEYLLRHTDSARIHNNLAMAYSESGRYEDALREYQTALDYGFPYPQVHHNMANTYVALGQYEQAEEHYYQALGLNKYFFHSYYKLIDLYLRQENSEKALQITQQAQEHLPSVPDFAVIELQLLKQNKLDTYESRKQELIIQYAGHPSVVKTLQSI